MAWRARYLLDRVKEMDVRGGPIVEKYCPTCELEIEDGEPVVALMLTRYKKISSAVNFAIHQPTECLEIIHRECFDYDDDECDCDGCGDENDN